jgi:hypothetical protein
MGRQKLRLYGDADIEGALEDHLRQHKHVNYRGTRELRSTTRDDRHHYRESLKQRRVLISHNDDFLDNEKYPLHETDGVIVVKRRQDLQTQALAFEKFLRWFWGPVIRDGQGSSTLGFFKIELSVDGFHYWRRLVDGSSEEDYHAFLR